MRHLNFWFLAVFLSFCVRVRIPLRLRGPALLLLRTPGSAPSFLPFSARSVSHSCVPLEPSLLDSVRALAVALLPAFCVSSALRCVLCVPFVCLRRRSKCLATFPPQQLLIRLASHCLRARPCVRMRWNFEGLPRFVLNFKSLLPTSSCLRHRIRITLP